MNKPAVDKQEALQRVQFLERQTHYPDQIMVNDRLIEVLDPAPGQKWLEVGSGSGSLCRQVARHLLPDGQITGIDPSIHYIEAAQEYARQSNSPVNIRFFAANGLSLPFEGNHFDGAFAARVLLNVNDPDSVLIEIHRVLKQQARLVVMDWDFETFTINHSNRYLTRKILHWRADHYNSNSWSGRQLTARMKKAGLKDIDITPVVSVAASKTHALYEALFRAAVAALQGGGISQTEFNQWTEELETHAVEGTFFASLTYFIVSGYK